MVDEGYGILFRVARGGVNIGGGVGPGKVEDSLALRDAAVWLESSRPNDRSLTVGRVGPHGSGAALTSPNKSAPSHAIMDHCHVFVLSSRPRHGLDTFLFPDIYIALPT